jgi:hypothetical protein
VSMFRKTVLATAIVGAGLGSMSGAAFAGNYPGVSSQSSDDQGSGSHHHHGHHGHHGSKASTDSSSCTNNVDAANVAKGGSLVDVLGGAQTIVPVNLCHNANGNQLLNDNHLNVL